MIFLPEYDALLHHLIIIEPRYGEAERRPRFDHGKCATGSKTGSAGKFLRKKASEDLPADPA
jgi:hypothetical protein